MTSDPHTLDDYAAALAVSAPRLFCGVDAVRRVIWGDSGGRDETEFALDELVAQGRADRTFDGRYKARGAAPAEPEEPTPGRAMALAEEDAGRRQTADGEALSVAPPGLAWEPRARNAGGGWVLRAWPSRKLRGGLRSEAGGWKWWTRGEACGEGVAETLPQAAAIVIGADALDQRLRAAVEAVPALEVTAPSVTCLVGFGGPEESPDPVGFRCQHGTVKAGAEFDAFPPEHPMMPCIIRDLDLGDDGPEPSPDSLPQWEDYGGAPDVPVLAAHPEPSPDCLPSPAEHEGAVPELEEMPPVCPGCHAVGEEPCAPGCIDAEIEAEHRHAIESGDYDDEPAAGDAVEFDEPEVVPVATEEERSGDARMDRHYRCRCVPHCKPTPPAWYPSLPDHHWDKRLLGGWWLRRDGQHHALGGVCYRGAHWAWWAEGEIPNYADDEAAAVIALVASVSGGKAEIPAPALRTIEDVADKHAPERVIEEARALAARLPVARARLKERLDQRLVGVSRDRAMLAELDRYAGALGASDG